MPFSVLGNGWGPTFIENQQEWDFLEQNLKTDLEQDYFIGGSISDETYFNETLLHRFTNVEFYFDLPYYVPRRSGNIFLNICII